MRKKRRPPMRMMPPGSAALPAFGPCVPGRHPYILPSVYCSWCGSETLVRADVKVCPDCDLAPATPSSL